MKDYNDDYKNLTLDDVLREQVEFWRSEVTFWKEQYQHVLDLYVNAVSISDFEDIKNKTKELFDL